MLDADTQPSLTKRDIYTTSGTQLGKSTNGLSSIRKLINDDDNDSIDDNASTSTIDTTGCHPAYAASTIPSDVSPIRTTNATTIEKLPSISSLHSYTSISTSQFSHYTFSQDQFFRTHGYSSSSSASSCSTASFDSNTGTCRNDSLSFDLSTNDSLQSYWDDQAINFYYQVIHPTLPILPHSKLKLKAWLSNCQDTSLSSALLSGILGISKLSSSTCATSLFAETPVTSSTNSSPEAISIHKSKVLNAVLSVLADSKELESFSSSQKGVFVVLLVFLFLFTNDSFWLGSAVSTIYGINSEFGKDYNGNGNDNPNSNHQTILKKSDNIIFTETDFRTHFRRMFLILVILDCLNNASTRQPTLFSENAIDFDETRDLSVFAGSQSGIYMTKLCLIFRNAENVKHHERNSLFRQQTLCFDPMRLTNSIHGLLTELEDIKLEIENLWDSAPILKAVYYSVEISVLALNFMLYSVSGNHSTSDLNNKCFINASRMLETLQELSAILVSPLISSSVLVPHFYSIVIDNVCRLAQILEPRVNAEGLPFGPLHLFSIQNWDPKYKNHKSTESVSGVSSQTGNVNNKQNENVKNTHSCSYENVSLLQTNTLKLLDDLLLISTVKESNLSELQSCKSFPKVNQLSVSLFSKNDGQLVQKLCSTKISLQSIMNVNQQTNQPPQPQSAPHPNAYNISYSTAHHQFKYDDKQPKHVDPYAADCLPAQSHLQPNTNKVSIKSLSSPVEGSKIESSPTRIFSNSASTFLPAPHLSRPKALSGVQNTALDGLASWATESNSSQGVFASNIN